MPGNVVASGAPPAGAANTCGLTVYYDGACPLCRREVAFFRARTPAADIDWVDASRADGETLADDLTRAQALARFHVRLPDGRLASGARGFGALWAVTPGLRWLSALAGSRVAQPLFEVAYRGFLRWRPQLQKLASRFEVGVEVSDDWLIRELRSNDAGEAGAVAIYRGILAVTRRAPLRAFALRHLATEQRHLDTMRTLVPRASRSKLLPLWRAAGFVTGALPALCGAPAVYATVETIETFVDRHYSAQIVRLAGHPRHRALRATLQALRDDERAHRDEARLGVDDAPGLLLRLWLRAVRAGSALGVVIARRI